MQCLHINFQKAFIILLAFFLNAVQNGHMALNHMDAIPEDKTQKTPINSAVESIKPVGADVILFCSSRTQCDDLPVECLNCPLNLSCIYGETLYSMCEVKDGIMCVGNKKFKKEYMCRYCYQTEPWEHKCKLQGNCNSVDSPRITYKTNCTVDDNLLCLGRRTFFKNVKCNWTGGHKWSTALALSITLGGFGADRFYLGHWQEGIGKLFSFGGLGVWTIIDVILISLHYLGPADGSLYI